jgi:hypothetical protein
MSEDKPERHGQAPPSVSADLQPYVGLEPCAEVELRDSSEVDAAFAEINQAVAEWTAEAEAEAAKRGVGNVAAHVGPVRVPAGRAGAPATAEPKVEIAVIEPVRALPAGNPTLPTREIDTRAMRRPLPAAASTTKAAPLGSRTVGGNTERLRVAGSARGDAPKPSSPWTRDAGAAVRADALPSSLGPREGSAPSDEKPASEAPRAPTKPTKAITIALLLVALLVGVLALRTRRTTEGAPVEPATPPTTATVPAVRAVTPPAPPPTTGPVAPPPASATGAAVLSPVPSATGAAALSPVPSATHAPGRPRVGPKPSHDGDDPYGEAVKPPSPPSPPPAAPATAQPTVAPNPAPPPSPAAPKPTASPAPAGAGEFFNRDKLP